MPEKKQTTDISSTNIVENITIPGEGKVHSSSSDEEHKVTAMIDNAKDGKNSWWGFHLFFRALAFICLKYIYYFKLLLLYPTGIGNRQLQWCRQLLDLTI